MQSNLGEDWTRLTTTYLTHVILETTFCLLVRDKDIVIFMLMDNTSADRFYSCYGVRGTAMIAYCTSNVKL